MERVSDIKEKYLADEVDQKIENVFIFKVFNAEPAIVKFPRIQAHHCLLNNLCYKNEH